MKRLIAAVLILIFIISVCAIDRITIKYFCTKTQKELTVCRELFLSGETKEAIIRCRRLKNNWKHRQACLAIFVNHSLLDAISISVSRLSVAKDEDIFLGEYAEITWGLSQIVDEETFSVKSFY